MKLIFVIDLMNGKVVRGYKGERKSYRPINEYSKIVDTSNPVKVVKKLEPKYLYIADLDRIMGKGSNLNVTTYLKDYVDEIMLDYGFKEPSEVFYSISPILGTETFNIRKLEEVKCNRAYVSVDIRDKLLDASNSFKDWIDAIEFLNSYKLRGVILLTLHKVGTSTSLDCNLIEKAIKLSNNPIYVGGGVKNIEDLKKAKSLGCEGVLVSTAFHNKSIPKELIKNGKF